MELKLTGKTKIKDVKKQFATFFPFLKLEFVAAQHNEGQSSVLAETFSDSTCLAEISPVLKDTSFTLSPSTTVAELEQRFQSDLGLPVQVFRKTGNLWLETVETDNLTLQKQNSMGSESVRPVRFNLHTLFL